MPGKVGKTVRLLCFVHKALSKPGSDMRDREVAIGLMNDTGFDGYDAGLLAESWRHDILKDFEAVDFFHGEHPGVMYSHRKLLIRKSESLIRHTGLKTK